MTRITFYLAVSVLVATLASADPYWIAYEADEYPENVGWRRIYRNEDGWYEGGAERSIEDGIFVLDTRRHYMISDYYKIERQMDPDPGETFVAEWRLKVVEANRSLEAGVWIARDEPPGYVMVEYMEDELWIGTEHWSYPIDPYLFHTYRIESADMIDYSLWIDDVHVHDGVFFTPTAADSFFAFGDFSYGGAVTSLTEWDYVRFGVIPEPATILTFVLLALLAGKKPRR
jgi:hypothetical protein